MKTNMAASVSIENKIIRIYFLLLITLLPADGAKDMTEKQIYYDVEADNFAMCFKRFNATHEIGCSSSRRGNVGVIHHVTSKEDIDWMLEHGPHQPYVVVLNISMFNSEVIHQLAESGKVNGIAVLPYNETEIPNEFSPDTSCPADRFGLYHNNSEYGGCRKTSWNKMGNGLMFEKLPFPLVTLTNIPDADFIIQCYNEHNKPLPVNGSTGDLAGIPAAREYPLCAMKVSAVMDGAKDTPTCFRRSDLVTNLNPQKYCDPLGNMNIYAYMDSLNASALPELENNSVIIVAARLDSFSMFEGLYPGVDSATLSFVALHAIAEALGKVKDDLLEDIKLRPVLFILFHGEAFDYIGSSRFVYDMMKNKFAPLTLDRIGSIVEIGQIGVHDDTDETTYIHTDPLSRANPDTDAKLNELSKMLIDESERIGLKMKNASAGLPLPPASLQRFLRERYDVPGVVIANHDSVFTNRYYNSMFDVRRFSGLDYPVDPTTDPSMYDHVTSAAERVAKVATSVARVVYRLVKGNNTSDSELSHRDIERVAASNETVTHLIYCFTVDAVCDLLRETVPVANVKAYLENNKTYLSRYVSVAFRQANMPTVHHYSLLSYWLGTPEPLNTTDKQCAELEKNSNKKYSFVYIQGPLNSTDNKTRENQCIRATVSVSQAVSPAFEIPKYDWMSGDYSSWTESVWPVNAFEVRVFLLPNPTQEIVTLCAGIAVLSISLATVYLFHKKSLLIFSN